MSRYLISILGIFAIGVASANAQDSQPTYSSASELATSLTSLSETAVTRDNYVSLLLSNLYLAPVDGSRQTKYALVVDVTLTPDTGGKPDTYSYVLEQPIDAAEGTSPVASWAAGFRTIFANVPLRSFREVQIQLYLIRLDEAQRKQFTQVAGLFGSMVQKSMFLPLMNVLGLGDEAQHPGRVLSFDGRFLIPPNYWAHQNAKAQRFPTINNDAPIAITFQVDSPRNNTSLLNFLKNAGNAISQVVSGRSIVGNFDKVQGIAVFSFTKNQFSPVPAALNTSLEKLKAEAERMTLNVKDATINIQNGDFLHRTMLGDMPPIGRESVAIFLELADLYVKYRQVDEATKPSTADSDALIAQFQAWLAQSSTRLQQSSAAGPRVKGIYPNAAGGDEVFPVIIYPYGLGDSLLVSSVLWQLRLHEYVATLAARPESAVRLHRFSFTVRR